MSLREHTTEDEYGGQQHQPGIDVKETSQGVVNQTSVKDENTIITSDQVPESSSNVSQFPETDLENSCNTEPIHTFPTILNRWIRLWSQTVEPGSKGDIVAQFAFPESIFSSDSCSPNVLPFSQFVYGKMSCEIKFVVSSNKYKCGKLIASVIPDPAGLWDGATNAYYNTESGLQRQFVFIDCDGPRTVTLNLNWIFHRTFIRLLNSEYKGIKAMEYIKVIVQQLSPVRVAEGEDARVTLSAFAKISDNKFAAMTYKAVKQAPIYGGLDTQTVRGVVNKVTKAYDDVYEQFCMDKPSMFFNQNYVIPTPRIFMSASRTLSDAVPLRVDPSKLTIYNPSHRSIIQYHSLLQIARIWGLVGSFEWSTGKNAGDELASYSTDPSDFMDTNYEGTDRHLTPVEYITNMYMFRNGCVEFRFDFVSTFFHCGSVMISIEFGKLSGSTDFCQSSSTYTKVFSLGDQKTVSITVPYIYDTVWRRNANVPVSGCYDYKQKALRSGLITMNMARVKVRVVNPLIANKVANTIQVLVFARAGPNYSLKCPIQMNAIIPSYLPPGDVMVDWPPSVEIKEEKKGETTLRTKHITLATRKMYENSAIKTLTATEKAPPANATSLVAGVDKKIPTHFMHAKLGDANTQGGDEKRSFSVRMGKLYTAEFPAGIDTPVPSTAYCANNYCNVGGKWVYMAEKQNQGDQDKTEDFGSPSMPMTQISENHTNISDMLKKPLLLMENTLVSGSLPIASGIRSVFCIPCMPPQPNMFPTKYSDLFNSACVRSIHAAITSMFRFWRGSMRYILIFHPQHNIVNPLIKVAYIPHSGRRIIGNTKELYGNSTQDGMYEKFSIGSTGIPFEIVMPQINPTINVEVPFYTEVNWAMLHQGPAPGGSNQEMPWRDKMDENVGHIVIESSSDVVMDVIWQAGDDFQLAGFIGCPRADRSFIKYTTTDNYAQLQGPDGYDPVMKQGISDWINKDALTSYAKPVAVTAVSYFAPAFTMPMMAACAVPTVAKMDKIVDDFTRVSGSAKEIADILKVGTNVSVNDSTRAIHDVSTVTRQICDIIKNALGGVVHMDIQAVITNSVCDIIVMLQEFTWLKFSLFVVKLLVQVRMIELSDVMETARMLSSLIVSYLGPAQHQAGEDSASANRGCDFLVSLIVVGFFRYLGQTAPTTIPSFTMFLREIANIKNWSLAQQLTKVLTDIFSLVKYVFQWCLGYVDPSVEAMRMLGEKKVFLKTFIEDAQTILLEQNAQYLRTPQGKMKFWVTLCNAMQIQQSLCMAPEERASPILTTLCGKVIQKGNEMHTLLSCAPVRYEPIIVVLEGSAGIGKSRLVNELAIEMLDSIGFKSHTTDVVYVRNPGTDYWNGYNNHPVIVFDDFLNLCDQESVRVQLQELYQLKSCATFNPNMAAIPEKDIRANPLIVFLCVNDAFPYVDLVRCKTAFFRRRDILIHAFKKQEFSEQVTGEIDQAVLAKYDHLSFYQYMQKDSREKKSPPFNYVELKEYLRKYFTVYHKKEKLSILERIKTLQRVLPENAQRLNIVGDPFSLFYKSLIDSGMMPEVNDDLLPSEQVKQYVEMVNAQIDSVPTLDEQITQLRDNAKFPKIESVIRPYYGSVRQPRRPDLPVGQVQSDYIDFCDRMGKHMQRMAHAIRQCSSEYFSTWIRLHEMVESMEYQECCVCRDVKPIAKRCPNSTETSQHVVCSTCSNALTNAGHGDCPICRNPNFDMVVDYKYGIFTRFLYKLSGNVLNGIVHTLSYFLDGAGFNVRCASSNFAMILLSMLGGFSVAPWVVPSLAVSMGWYVAQELYVELGIPINVFEYAPGLPEGYDSAMVGINIENARIVTNYVGSQAGQLIGDALDIHPAVTPGVFPIPHDAVAGIHPQCDNCGIGAIPAENIRYEPKENEVCNHDRVKEGMMYRPRFAEGPNKGVFIAVHDDEIGVEHHVIPCYPCTSNNCRWRDRDTFVRDIQSWLQANDVIFQSFSHNIRYNKDQYLPPYINWTPYHARNPLQGIYLQADLAVEAVPETWWMYLSGKVKQFVEWVQGNILMATSLIGLIGSIMLGYSAYQYLTNVPESESVNVEVPEEPSTPVLPVDPLPDLDMAAVQSSMYDEAGNRVAWRNAARQHQGKHRMNVKFAKQNAANLGFQGDQEVYAAANTFSKNLGMIVIMDGDAELQWYGFVGFKFHFAIIPKHYVWRLRKAKAEGKTFVIRQCAKLNIAFDYKFEDDDFKDFWNEELCSFMTPAEFPLFSNLTRFIMTEQEYSDYSIGYDGVMVEQPRIRHAHAIVIRDVQFKGFIPEMNLTDTDGSLTTVQNVISYNYSKMGACGSLILSNDATRPILGMHIAGVGVESNGVGYAAVLTRNMFEEVDKAIRIEGYVKHPDIVETKTCKTSVEEVVLAEVGVLPGHLQTHIPTHTNIVPSLLSYDLPKAQTEPAILSTKDERFQSNWDSPIIAGVKKYGKVVGHMDQRILDEIQEELADFMMQFRSPIMTSKSKQPLSESDAIVGIPGVPFYDAMPRNTSAGWPWSRGTHGKFKYIDITEKDGKRVAKLVPAVRAKYDEEMELRKKGFLVPTLFSDVLKDERRKPTKTRKEGGTRVVCGSPIQYTVAVRRYWQHFAAALMHHRLKNFMAPGINPDGPEWGLLFDKLSDKSTTNFLAFDYSNFGPAFSSQALEVAINVAVHWLKTNTEYSEEDLLAAEVLLRESQHSFHTVRNVVIQQYSGAPSGNPITTILNCLVNIIYILYAWKKVVRNKQIGSSLTSFKKHVFLCVYGDDMIASVDDEASEIFNGITASEALLEDKIQVTDALKTGVISKFILPHEATFLKRGFVTHPTRLGQWLAPLDTVSIEECAKWVHKKDSMKQATLENAETSVRLAYTCGKEYFEYWKGEVNKACISSNLPTVTYTWDYIDRMVFEQHIPLRDFELVLNNKFVLSDELD